VNTAYAEFVKTQADATELEVVIRVEGDEFWSYVGEKSNQRWTWYVVERASGTILAHHNDRRTDAACQALLKKLEIFPIGTYYTDNWQSYSKFIDAERHVIGKEHTQKIERTNLTFRTHIKRLHRKTICFSKDETLHDNVIGLYIEHEYYQNKEYAQTA
jgi:insertion element IS1 protein InsB